ncbi:MAG: tetratricopeptide repeat protein [Crocinitomicaceae bacterium]
MTYETLLLEAKHKVKDNVLDKALELLTKALELNPRGKDALYERGVLYTNLKQSELALFDFNKLIELEDDNPFFYACRAFIKAGLNDKKGAMEDYQITIKLDPEDSVAHNNLGLLQEQNNYKSEAERSFAKSNSIIGYNPSRYDNQEQKIEEVIEDETEVSLSKSELAKSVFTKKSIFKEFIGFIKNGFKIK